MSHLYQLLHEGKAHFQARDYEACMAVMHELLREAPGNAEAAWLMKEAQRQWEEQRSLEEFEIYVENLKKEAMDLFDKECYEQCLGMFGFLVKVEPENHMLRDYLELSQQMVLEMIETGSSAAKPGETAVQTEAKTKEFRLTQRGIDEESEEPSLTQAPVTFAPHAGESPSPPVLSSTERAGFTPSVQEVKEAQSPPMVKSPQETITEAEKQKIIKKYLALTASIKRRRRRMVWLTAVALLVLVAVILVAGPFLNTLLNQTSSLEIHSNPEGANIFINNQLKGQTQCFQRRIPAGSYDLRIEKEGYIPYQRQFILGKHQTASLFVQLEKLKIEPEPAVPAAAVVSLLPESALKTSEPELKKEVETSPATIACSVVHVHLLGSCTGRLKIEGDVISFRPAGESKDGFSQKLAQIGSTELGDKLVIQFKNRTYRFETFASNGEENRRKLNAFYQQMKRSTPRVK